MTFSLGSNESAAEEDEVDQPPRKKTKGGQKKEMEQQRMKWSCGECKVEVRGDRFALRDHMRTEHPRNEYKCEFCGKVRLIV